MYKGIEKDERLIKVVLGVCTFRRPVLLQACLKTVCDVIVPDGHSLEVIIVDNDCSSEVRELVTAMGHDLQYVPEASRGISFVRNRVLSLAEASGADWIIFLDDDQTVPVDWLNKMIASQLKTRADVVRSAVRHVSENGEVVQKPYPHWQECGRKVGVATNGVMFSSKIVSEHKLRFDERFAFSGGEDRLFFLTAHKIGAKMVRTPIAIAQELSHSRRDKVSAVGKRMFCQGWVNAFQDKELFGKRAALAEISRSASKALRGMLGFLVGALVYPFNKKRALRKIKKSASSLGWFVGLFFGLFSSGLPDPYRKHN